eukprot:scaffold122904_cov30-Tisochrysis_lutea.AAC.5
MFRPMRLTTRGSGSGSCSGVSAQKNAATSSPISVEGRFGGAPSRKRTRTAVNGSILVRSCTPVSMRVTAE